jgi:hypothetical protein
MGTEQILLKCHGGGRKGDEKDGGATNHPTPALTLTAKKRTKEIGDKLKKRGRDKSMNLRFPMEKLESFFDEAEITINLMVVQKVDD